jgi:hypothetical protein
MEKDAKSVEIIRPILRGRDIARYQANFADLYLINVHNGISSKNIRPVDIKTYPAIKKHLDKHWNKIKNRDDQGITPYHLRSCAYMEDFSKQKIVWKRVGSILRFCYDDNKYMALDSCCFATGKKLKYILAILNSKVGHYMLASSPKTGTGDLLISVQAIEPLLIPDITEREEKEITVLINNLLDNKVKMPQDVLEVENKLESIINYLYKFTKKETEYIGNYKHEMFSR